MMKISEGQALTALLHQIRADWDPPGIAAALRKAEHLGSFADLAVAACRVAANPSIRTPHLIGEPGPHWQALATGRKHSPLRCHDHPAQPASHCQDCIDQAVPMPDWFPRFRRDTFALPPDVAALAPQSRPAPTTPSELCGLCRDADCAPGRGICASCDTTTRRQA